MRHLTRPAAVLVAAALLSSAAACSADHGAGDNGAPGDLVPSFEAAPARLRQDVLVAAFAESLRGGPWAEHVSLAQLVAYLDVVAAALPGDPYLAELTELVRTAAGLAG